MSFLVVLFFIYIIVLVFLRKIWVHGPDINWMKIFKNLLKKPSGNEIAGVDFLRFLAMQWILFGHTSGLNPKKNK